MPEQFYDAASYRARDSVGYLVRRLASNVTARVESALVQHEFTLTQWSVLMHLRDGLARTASDLAAAFHHDSGALTRLLDQLEKRGLLARRRSSRDRRVVELDLTAQGRKVIDTLLPVVVAELNGALAPLSRSEFVQFRGMLMRLLDHTVETRPPHSAPPAATATTAAARKPSPRVRAGAKSIRKTARRR